MKKQTSNVNCHNLFGCQFDNISLYLKYAYPLTYQFYFCRTVSLKHVHTCAEGYIYRAVIEFCVTAED